MWHFARILALTLLIFSPSAVVGSCAGSDCERNSDCAYAQCISGECVAECKLDIDCQFGLVCNTQIGRCDPPSDGSAGTGGGSPDGSAGTGAANTGGAAGTTGGGAPNGGGGAPNGGGAPSGGGGTAGNKLELDLCGSDTECGSGMLCRPFGKGLAKRCTRTCGAIGPTAQCPSGSRCEAIGSEQFCMLSDIGKPCTQAAECQYACITAPKYCTSVCSSGADCPNGWGCMAVSGQKVCVKAAEPCDTNNTTGCIAPAACDTSVNLVVAGCTLACSTAADCPVRAAGMAAWTCDGLCRRPTSGATAIYGPLEGGSVPAQYACNLASQVVNVCGDGQHIDFNAFTIPNPPSVNCSSPVTTDGVAGDACVDSCRYGGGCPSGFLCSALGSVSASSRIGLCLPALGAGAVGAACNKDADCFFGYCNRTAKKCSRDCTEDGLCTSGSSCIAAGGPSIDGLPFRRCE